MSDIVTAGILVIGDEILSGRTKDKNIGFIAEYLTNIGIDLREVRVVPDDEVEIVRALKIPLAIVQGSEEQIVDLGYLQRLAAPTLWRGQVQVIEGAGHATQWEQPEAFDKILDEFASSL